MRTTQIAGVVWLTIAVLAVGCDRQSTPASGRLIVRSEPGVEADIFLNGDKRDQKTNAVFTELKPGRYQIELMKPSASASETPETGEASVEVEPGRTTRVVINLNRMAIVPVADDGPVRPITRGQKSIFDFYAALSAKDAARAFAHLGQEAKSAYGGLGGFQKTWATVDSVRIREIKVVSYDSTRTEEINETVLDVFETTETSSPPLKPSQGFATITTTEDDFGGSGLPLILELREDPRAFTTIDPRRLPSSGPDR